MLRVRILRAPAGHGQSGGGAARPAALGAATPEPELGRDTSWQVIYDGDTGSFRDRGLPAATAWRYAVFARDGDGPWTLWRDEAVTLP